MGGRARRSRPPDRVQVGMRADSLSLSLSPSLPLSPLSPSLSLSISLSAGGVSRHEGPQTPIEPSRAAAQGGGGRAPRE